MYFKHCGKTVEIRKSFPQIHNLLTVQRHKIVKKKLQKKIERSFSRKRTLAILDLISTLRHFNSAIGDGEIHITFARGDDDLSVGNFTKKVFSSD